MPDLIGQPERAPVRQGCGGASIADDQSAPQPCAIINVIRRPEVCEFGPTHGTR